MPIESVQVSTSEYGNFDDKHFRLPGENYLETMTPIFMYENVFNEQASMRENRDVFELLEMVELRFAGTTQYKPKFPVESTYRTMANGRVITWAERFPKQYQAFLDGDQQHALGTPLEELKGYGITPAQLSMARACGVMSIEALDQLEGPGLKRLGLHGNELKPMARRWMQARAVSQSDTNADEIADLRAKVAELLAAQQQAPAPTDVFADKTDAEIKTEIKELTGAYPRGNPSRPTLVSMLETAMSA